METEDLSQNHQSAEKIFQQWNHFIVDHSFTWKGILSRYDSKGKIIAVLDSTRKFTATSDLLQMEHYLCFIDRDDPSKVLEKQWTLDKPSAGIVHPVDPKAIAMFSSYLSGVMSRPCVSNYTNYAEIFLNEGNRRISTVISYRPDSSEEINGKSIFSEISLFREVKLEASSFPWSEEQPEITPREYPPLEVINSYMLESGSFNEIPVANDIVSWSKEDRLIWDFPDGISLNLPKTLEPSPENNLILSWRYTPDRIKRAIVQFSHTRRPDLITQECVIISPS
jgi:hypothetical protein